MNEVKAILVTSTSSSIRSVDIQEWTSCVDYSERHANGGLLYYGADDCLNKLTEVYLNHGYRVDTVMIPTDGDNYMPPLKPFESQ